MRVDTGVDLEVDLEVELEVDLEVEAWRNVTFDPIDGQLKMRCRPWAKMKERLKSTSQSTWKLTPGRRWPSWIIS